MIGWDQDSVHFFLSCPSCGHSFLERRTGHVACLGCGRHLRLIDEAILTAEGAHERSLFPGVDPEAHCALTEKVRAFYSKNPFPNYDGVETIGELLAKSSRSIYASMLDRQIPLGAKILEVGCGTGQLGLFLSLGGRKVIGVDLSEVSLRLASEFKRRNGIVDCDFILADIFDMPLQKGAFDLVICKGVLHHTSNARLAFEEICKFVRSDGYIIVGLYNALGRIPVICKRFMYKTFWCRTKPIDYVLKILIRNGGKKDVWLEDQYVHPHETRHTVDEVLGWFKDQQIRYISAVPPIRLGDGFDPDRSLFAPSDPGTLIDHLCVQLYWMFTISREGALFDIIGRKNEAKPFADRSSLRP